MKVRAFGLRLGGAPGLCHTAGRIRGRRLPGRHPARLRETEIALHNGDAGPRSALWSHDDPVTLFGAEVNRTGWSEMGPTFGWLATRFTECTSLEYEIIVAGASGDLGYLAAIERISASANGDPASFALRATTIFHREQGVWRAVHRHGDRYQQD